MHILLPPSETKRSGGHGSGFAPDALSHAAALGDARTRVRAALESLSRDEESAAKALKLGAKSRGEIAHNLRLGSSGTMPAIERYTGVLYDALDVASLDAPALDWLGSHVSVQSALFGLVAATDEVPAYRLSGGSALPGLGAGLKQVWRAAHAGVDWPAFGWVLDLRSKDYAALAPVPPGQGAGLHVAQRGPAGEVRALNHFNKAAKGDLVRRLALSGASIDSADEFVAWARDEGLEVVRGADGRGAAAPELTLVTSLGAPALTAG